MSFKIQFWKKYTPKDYKVIKWNPLLGLTQNFVLISKVGFIYGVRAVPVMQEQRN